LSIEAKRKKLADLKAKMDALYQAISPLQKEAVALQNEIREIEFKNLLPLTPEKVLTTNYQIFESSENYQALNKYLDGFKFIKVEGYNPETQLKALTIKLSQTESVDDQLKEINQFLPFVSKVDYEKIDKYKRIPRPNDLEGQVRVVKIFEHTCSEHGVYSLLVGDNDVASLLLIRYSSPKILVTLPLSEMIEYVREHHPYELKEEGEDLLMEKIDLDLDE
jgi:hypothetical protein